MLHRGVIDSPPDQSQTLRQLEAIEKALRSAEAGDSDDSGFALATQHERVRDELWALLLDVVCSPLWVRLRAAALLNVCFAVREDALRVEHRNAYWIRSIVSSTCQALEELDATERHQEANLFEWLEFLEHVLVATPSEVFAKVLRHSMYVSMLTKMLRLLSNCSTKVFAATTMCVASFYAHELQCQRNAKGNPLVLVDQVLAEHREGMQHFGGALLHVINSCGYPCPQNRVVHLWNSLQLVGDILAHKQASQLVFVNDFKVLVDICIRECSDLPLEDLTRLQFLLLLDRVLGSALFLQSHMYRKGELLKILEDLLETGARDDTGLPEQVVAQSRKLLLSYIDLLD